MNKFKLSLITLSCALALTACSSSSKGGSDNSDQVRKVETELTQKIVELTKKVESSEKEVQRAQNNYTQAQTQADKAEAEAVKLNAEVANLKKAQAELALAQAQQSQASSQDIEKLKADLEAANNAANAANKAAEELQAKEAKAEAERKAAEERLKQLEALQAEEKARIPLSDQIFGGVNGTMTDSISGGVMILGKDQPVLERAKARDLREIYIVDETGRGKDQLLSLAGSDYNDYIGQVEYSSNIANTDQFKSTTFGIYAPDAYNPTTQYLYAYGNPTDVKQIPTAGKVEYVGGAAYSKEGVRFNRTTTVKATADFDKKVIDINIAKKENWKGEVQVPQMDVAAKITGNSFAGETNGIKTQGGFFGENAKELSGIFTNEADQSRGVFGAIKQ